VTSTVATGGLRSCKLQLKRRQGLSQGSSSAPKPQQAAAVWKLTTAPQQWHVDSPPRRLSSASISSAAVMYTCGGGEERRQVKAEGGSVSKRGQAMQAGQPNQRRAVGAEALC